MEYRLGSTTRCNVLLQLSIHHLVQHLEERDQITLPRPIGPDQDVKRPELDIRVLDRAVVFEM